MWGAGLTQTCQSSALPPLPSSALTTDGPNLPYRKLLLTHHRVNPFKRSNLGGIVAKVTLYYKSQFFMLVVCVWLQGIIGLFVSFDDIRKLTVRRWIEHITCGRFLFFFLQQCKWKAAARDRAGLCYLIIPRPKSSSTALTPSLWKKAWN